MRYEAKPCAGCRRLEKESDEYYARLQKKDAEITAYKLESEQDKSELDGANKRCRMLEAELVGANQRIAWMEADLAAVIKGRDMACEIADERNLDALRADTAVAAKDKRIAELELDAADADHCWGQKLEAMKAQLKSLVAQNLEMREALASIAPCVSVEDSPPSLEVYRAERDIIEAIMKAKGLCYSYFRTWLEACESVSIFDKCDALAKAKQEAKP